MTEKKNNNKFTFINVAKDSLKKLIQSVIREQLLPYEQNKDEIIFYLQNNEFIKIENIVLSQLIRCLELGKIVHHNAEGLEHEILNSLDLFTIITSELKNNNNSEWSKVALEIENHLRNAMLSQQCNIDINSKIITEAKLQRCSTLIEWVQNSSMSDKSIFFEQYVPLGLPLHPCSKTKFGFSEEDVKSFSPEFKTEIPLLLAAIKKENLWIETMDGLDYGDWFAQNYSWTWANWLKSLKALELKPENYLPIPIHPWQNANIIPTLFKDEIAQRVIHILPNVTILATPTLSFRTLAPITNKNGAYIKLPVGVQATAIFRTLSPASVNNTPKISRLLQEVFIKEANFSGRLTILYEQYGLHLKNITDEQSKHFAVIYRDNVSLQLQENELCIVVAALSEISPISAKPIFIELLELAGITQLSEVYTYFNHYVDLVLGSYLDLYLKYGISLDGNQQNTLAVFKQGQIVRFIYRDLEDIGLHVETLRRKNLHYHWDGSNTIFDQSKTVMRNSFIHTVFQSHLGELVLLLSTYFKSNESMFWHIIYKVTLERFEFLRKELSPQLWQEEYNSFLVNKWPCKAFLRMRLMKEYNPDGLYFAVTNPLSNIDQHI